jgi:hypothetical protein
VEFIAIARLKRAAACLRASRSRVDGRLHIRSIASLVELVTDLIVVVHGASVDDLDESSSRIVRVSDSLRRRGDEADQPNSDRAKGNFRRTQHDSPPLKAQMFRKSVFNARVLSAPTLLRVEDPWMHLTLPEVTGKHRAGMLDPSRLEKSLRTSRVNFELRLLSS